MTSGATVAISYRKCGPNTEPLLCQQVADYDRLPNCVDDVMRFNRLTTVIQVRSFVCRGVYIPERASRARVETRARRMLEAV